MGYYCLANDLHPDSGSAHNQMAVIALADGNHLNAVYHLYRALAIKEPHLLARGNLDLEFKKITSAWEKNRSQPKTDSLSTLVWWFVLLHARFYEGLEFATHDELEKEVLSRLALLLKEQPFGDTLEKIVIINVAAQSFAGERFTGMHIPSYSAPRISESPPRVHSNDFQEQGESATDDVFKSYVFCLGFNVRMMFVLLQVLLPELEDSSAGEELPTGPDGSQSMTREKITATTRRVLPALRQYSIWLASSYKLLTATNGNGRLDLHIKEMWKMYADVLTRLVNFFPVDDLQQADYLLEEDESTVGFKPFREPDVNPECNLYISLGGKELKPRCTDQGVERHHPNLEMQSRIRDILKFGLSFQLEEEIPITLANENGLPVFKFVEGEFLLASPPGSSQFSPPFVSTNDENGNSAFSYPITCSYDSLLDESVAASDSHHSMDTDMHRMVDSLLEPSSSGRNTASMETSYGMHSATANEVFAPMAVNGFETRLQNTPKMLPSLPDFYNSAFTPQPNELQPTSPKRPSTSRQLSPLSLSTSEERLAAAVALDEATGFASPRSVSWGHRSTRQITNPTSQSVNNILQQSLAEHYMPMSSSEFSESSSLYANSTPQTQRRFGANTLRASGFPTMNDSTHYPGGTDFDREMMLQSSIWNGSQPTAWGTSVQTPPGGQGG